ncbi:CBS domain-containing protein [Reinekea sp.]|jgi:acetoin utilization protein AcuB|uniref:CBS domain-containing protein n=1 Tax=Reinekea sp. TaxID=1970455 RepID=UPI002A830718|nr:CBS domain-containing protein [Reinekea sp.]
MTTDMTKIAPDDKFAEAQEILDNAPFSHLLVEQHGRLVGIVSDRDISRKIAGYLKNNQSSNFTTQLAGLTIRDIMTTDVLTIDRDTPIGAASVLLLENNISCLPIVDDNNVIEGIVTREDLLKYHVYSEKD